MEAVAHLAGSAAPLEMARRPALLARSEEDVTGFLYLGDGPCPMHDAPGAWIKRMAARCHRCWKTYIKYLRSIR